MNKNSKIFIAGHRGLVGSAILREIKSKGYNNLILKTSKELNLIKQQQVENFFQSQKPEIVILAAAKVGGIFANNTYRAEFIYNNLMIESNIIHNSFKNGVKKLIFLGSSCIYPKYSNQPIKEEELLTKDLEFTNEPYAIAKIAGIKLCENYNIQYGTNFISLMPTNIYGPGDNFDLETSHVLPALIRKFVEAKQQNKDEVILWGSGQPKREFLYVDDLAKAVVFTMEHIEFSMLLKNKKEIKNTHINIGSGKDITIKELAILIKNIVGFNGNIIWDKTKPDGTPRKLLDVSKINKLGWYATTDLRTGIEKTYEFFQSNNSF
jgi:GDP-L-fucose synthase